MRVGGIALEDVIKRPLRLVCEGTSHKTVRGRY